ncbi:uncharacterized protein [Drosophila kikkawai]|uniref:Reverse transcriptase n=1 Tax=Drosophila kikkawai TaxID=30033 RepID=A0ABM4GHX2_DROKI
MEEENPFAGRGALASSPCAPREEEEATAFGKSNKLSRTPPRYEAQEGGQSIGSTPPPKRLRDPASPTSLPRTTPAKKSKASEKAACLQDLQEMGSLLQEVSSRMMDKSTRHITVPLREMIARVKTLHSSILAASRAAAAGVSDRQESRVANNLCQKCAQITKSADKEQQTVTAWKKEASVQTEPWRRLSQPDAPGLPAPVLAPPLPRPAQQKSARAPKKPRAKPPAAVHDASEQQHRPARKPESQANPENDWEVVARKPRTARRTRPDAVIVHASGKSYSEVLAMVTRREDKQLSDLGRCVAKVRRTNNGNLLLEVAKGSAESASAMKESIEKVLGDSASVRATTEESKVIVLEVRNIDPITTKQEVCAALAGQFNFEAERVKVRSMRRGFAETQAAVVSLPVSLAKAVLHRGEVRNGWTICRIRERLGPVRCFRCLEPGHIAIHCKGPVDRSGCCINCGGPGHKAASCSKEPAAQDLLSQTVRELGSEVAVLSEPYRVGSSRDWATDRSGKAALWLCGEDAPELRDTKAAEGFVRANIGGIWLYSCYLEPSLSLEAFGRVLDELSSDLRGRSNFVVGGDFNAWAMESLTFAANASEAEGCCSELEARLPACNDRYKVARKELKTAIRNSKRECFLKLCDAADEDPWGGAFKMMVKRLNAGGSAPTDPATLESIVGTLFPNGRQVAICPSTELGDIRWVSEDEVLQAGRSLKIKKAPGPDAIPSRATKLSLSLLSSEVACLFNKPICLLDTIGKVFERVISTRLGEAIEAAGGLSPEQYGFTKGRSTLDAIARVVKIAEDAIAGTRWKGGTKSYCLVVTLDIRNAFNSADWSRTLESLRKFNIPGYLLNVALSYFSNRALTLDTSMGSREYNISAGVPQGSVLGPLLWNAMYDGVLRLPMPACTSLVGFADDVAIVVAAKEIAAVEARADTAIQAVEAWLALAGLELAAHKTEAVLISSRKAVETASVLVRGTRIRSQRAIKYLGVHIDTRLSFKEHLESCTRHQYGPKLQLSKATCEEWRRPTACVPSGSHARSAQSLRTELIRERKEISESLQDRRSPLSRAEVKLAARRTSMVNWQARWDSSSKGRWTHRLIPDLARWVERAHGQVSFYLSQVLSGHGCFRQYLKRFGHETEDWCPECGTGILEEAHHVLFECRRFCLERHELEVAAGSPITAETLVPTMLGDPKAWEAADAFAAHVMKTLRTLERRRKERPE